MRCVLVASVRRIASSHSSISDRPGSGAGDAQHRDLRLGDEVSVAEIQAQEVGVSGRVVGQPGFRCAAWTSGIPVRSRSASLGALSVESVGDRAARKSQLAADVAEGDAVGAQFLRLYIKAGWVHDRILAAPSDIYRCPRWDSNPHLMLFESIACCLLGYGDVTCSVRRRDPPS